MKLRTLCLAALVALGTAALSTQVLAYGKDKAETAAKPAQTLVDIAVGNPDFSTLVAALKAAGLVETLQGAGPFTVFAPTNAAFAKLPAGTVDTLLKPENKEQLTKVLTCHVVASEVMAEALVKMISDNGGEADVATVGGCVLKGKAADGKVTLTDENGGVSTVTIADVKQSNGVIHVVDAVILPKM